jgi:hypothetical protein
MSEHKLSSLRTWEYENSDKVHFKPEKSTSVGSQCLCDKEMKTSQYISTNELFIYNTIYYKSIGGDGISSTILKASKVLTEIGDLNISAKNNAYHNRQRKP